MELHWNGTQLLYIDESGQETEGRIFVVGAVIVENDHDEVLGLLEAFEARSRKRHMKWHRARPAFRQAYIDEVVNLTRLHGCLFFSVFPCTRRYNVTTAEAAARAIRLKAQGRYKVTVLVTDSEKPSAEPLPMLYAPCPSALTKYAGY